MRQAPYFTWESCLADGWDDIPTNLGYRPFEVWTDDLMLLANFLRGFLGVETYSYLNLVQINDSSIASQERGKGYTKRSG